MENQIYQVIIEIESDSETNTINELLDSGYNVTMATPIGSEEFYPLEAWNIGTDDDPVWDIGIDVEPEIDPCNYSRVGGI